MSSEEFAKRGAEFAKLMASADVSEEEKKDACVESFDFICSLPDDLDGDQNYVKWAINLPQMIMPQSGNLLMLILDIIIWLSSRSSNSFRTVASQKVGEFMTWLIRLPESFDVDAGQALSELWRSNHEELVAVLRNEASSASPRLTKACLESLIRKKLDLVDLAKLFLVFARDVRWCAEMMVSHFSDCFNDDEKEELKRLIKEATTPTVSAQPSPGVDTTAPASDESTVPNTPPVEGTSSVGVVGAIGPRKRKATPDGQAEQRGNHQVKRLTSGIIYIDKPNLTNCNVYITPGDGKTDVAECGDGEIEEPACSDSDE